MSLCFFNENKLISAGKVYPNWIVNSGLEQSCVSFTTLKSSVPNRVPGTQ